MSVPGFETLMSQLDGGCRHPSLSVIAPEEMGTVFRVGYVYPGTAAIAAVEVISWLQKLRTESPSDLSWLVDKGLHHSERERGRMRLDNKDEEARTQRIDQGGAVGLKLKKAAVSKRKKPKRKRNASGRGRKRLLRSR